MPNCALTTHCGANPLYVNQNIATQVDLLRAILLAINATALVTTVETATGDGVTQNFALLHAPHGGVMLVVSDAGTVEFQGTDFTITGGNTVHFPVAPALNNPLLFVYQYVP